MLVLRVIGSYTCNAACKYCYQNNLTNDKKIISINAELLVNFIYSYIKQNEITAIQFFWYGGETLCYFETILQINQKLLKIIPKKIKIYNDISTNGYILSSDILNQCRELSNLTFSISLEPNHKLQALYRYSTNSISYKELLKNSAECSQHYGTTIVFVLSYLNFKSVFNFSQYIKNNNMNIKNLDIFIGKLSNIENCLSNDLKISIIRLDHFIRIRNICYFNFVKFGINIPYTRFNPFNTGCNYFIKNSFVILPDENISKCHEHITDHIHIIGNLIDTHSDKIHQDLFTSCKGCKLLSICKGRCVDRILKKNKRVCVMKTIDGAHFKNFNTDIINEAFRMMTLYKSSCTNTKKRY